MSEGLFGEKFPQGVIIFYLERYGVVQRIMSERIVWVGCHILMQVIRSLRVQRLRFEPSWLAHKHADASWAKCNEGIKRKQKKQSMIKRNVKGNVKGNYRVCTDAAWWYRFTRYFRQIIIAPFLVFFLLFCSFWLFQLYLCGVYTMRLHVIFSSITLNITRRSLDSCWPSIFFSADRLFMSEKLHDVLRRLFRPTFVAPAENRLNPDIDRFGVIRAGLTPTRDVSLCLCNCYIYALHQC